MSDAPMQVAVLATSTDQRRVPTANATTDERLIAAVHTPGLPATEYADRLLSSAIFLMGRAVAAADNPAQTIRALRVALDLTAGE